MQRSKNLYEGLLYNYVNFLIYDKSKLLSSLYFSENKKLKNAIFYP